MGGRADSAPVRKVNCPQCGLPAVYSPENRFRPFCSERCRLIDLGQWATESYRLPADDLPTDDEPGAQN